MDEVIEERLEQRQLYVLRSDDSLFGLAYDDEADYLKEEEEYYDDAEEM